MGINKPIYSLVLCRERVNSGGGRGVRGGGRSVGGETEQERAVQIEYKKGRTGNRMLTC